MVVQLTEEQPPSPFSVLPDVNLAVSLIDAAPETLLREEKFPKELGEGGNERDLSLSTL